MKILRFLVIGILSLSLFSFGLAEDDAAWTLIPEAKDNVGYNSFVVEDISNPKGANGKDMGVWEKYDYYSKKLDVGSSFATGVFSWNTVFDYFKYIAKLLSQIGLVIGAAMIIYAGYKYAMGVFTQDTSKGGKDAIKGAIYGLLIVIFSYAIMRILLAMFW